jgi:hypothetical protein
MHHLKDSGRLIWLVAQSYTSTQGDFTMPDIDVEWQNLLCLSWDSVIDDPSYGASNKTETPDISLVGRCMPLLCKDPRDHIFGLAGLFAKSYPVDYSKSVVEFFTDLTAHVVTISTSSDGVDTLNYPDRALRFAYRRPDEFAKHFDLQWSSTSLPSWVPNYGLTTGNTIACNLDYPIPETLNTRIPARVFSIAPAVLSVYGVHCTTITRCAKRGYVDDIDCDFMGQAAYLALRLRELVTSHESSLTYLDALSRGLDLIFDAAPRHPYFSVPKKTRHIAGLKSFGCNYIAEYAPALLLLADITRLNNKGEDIVAAQFVAELAISIDRRCARRRTFLTSADSSIQPGFGCGPDRLRVGDEIFVPYGCSYPLVVRRVGNQGQHKLVGHCYLRGTMNAEVLHMDLPETHEQPI